MSASRAGKGRPQLATPCGWPFLTAIKTTVDQTTQVEAEREAQTELGLPRPLTSQPGRQPAGEG